MRWGVAQWHDHYPECFSFNFGGEGLG